MTRSRTVGGVSLWLVPRHARAAGFDPRELSEEYVYLRITPQEILAWREDNELKDRRIMRRGEWLG